MTTRIPSSLKWLVEKHRTLQSEIANLEENVEKLLHQREIKLKSLVAIDETIKLHEINVDPKKIPAKKLYQGRIPLKYGQLTRSIYEFLGQSKSGKTIKDITEYMFIKNNIEIGSNTDYLEIRKKVNNRIKNMVKEQKLVRYYKDRKPYFKLPICNN